MKYLEIFPKLCEICNVTDYTGRTFPDITVAYTHKNNTPVQHNKILYTNTFHSHPEPINKPRQTSHKPHREIPVSPSKTNPVYWCAGMC